MGGFISYFFAESSPTEETGRQQNEGSSPVSSSSPIPEKETSGLPHIPHKSTPEETPRTESIFQPTSTSNHIKDADQMNINVVYAGKTIEILIFPLEKISKLLQEACDGVHKNPKNMKLIFEGEQLDLKKTVSQYPKLRGGKKVNLIRVS